MVAVVVTVGDADLVELLCPEGVYVGSSSWDVSSASMFMRSSGVSTSAGSGNPNSSSIWSS